MNVSQAELQAVKDVLDTEIQTLKNVDANLQLKVATYEAALQTTSAHIQSMNTDMQAIKRVLEEGSRHDLTKQGLVLSSYLSRCTLIKTHNQLSNNIGWCCC